MFNRTASMIPLLPRINKLTNPTWYDFNHGRFTQPPHPAIQRTAFRYAFSESRDFM